MNHTTSDHTVHYDVIIIGAGPSGLSCALRLAQSAQREAITLRIAVIEKAAQVGGHIISGALLETRALDELLPQWRSCNPPPYTAVAQETFSLLTPGSAFSLPIPRSLSNRDNLVISLGQFCRWLAQEAESLGVEIYSGFSAAQLQYDGQSNVRGVVIADRGLDREGQPTACYQPGITLLAKQTILAEGCRGSLSETLIEKFNLRHTVQPQHYALAFKELWEIDPAQSQHRPGIVLHTLGWPLDRRTYGGGFLYTLDQNKVSVGFAVGLNYTNPYLDPHQEFQRYKTHPAIRQYLRQGRRLAYGARAVNEGGWQAIPKLTVPGAAIIGCAAGFLNVPKVKGIHTAMKSGLVLADVLIKAWVSQKPGDEVLHLSQYDDQLKASWLGSELYAVRNSYPAFRYGRFIGLLYSGLDAYLLRGRVPWTFRQHRPDHAQLKLARDSQPIDYPKADCQLTFDKPSSVYLSNVYHEENQPKHLIINRNESLLNQHHEQYDTPETRYCPAGVYEKEEGRLRVTIHASNCLHCKACDIKDPQQMIKWHIPQGGDGPHYEDL